MKKIILCLFVLIGCADNTSVESQNLNQLLKPNFEYRFVEMQCKFRSSNNLASLERLIPRIKEVIPEEISMTVAFRFVNDQIDTKSFYIWLKSDPKLNNENKIDIIDEVANCNFRDTGTNFGFSVINFDPNQTLKETYITEVIYCNYIDGNSFPTLNFAIKDLEYFFPKDQTYKAFYHEGDLQGEFVWINQFESIQEYKSFFEEFNLDENSNIIFKAFTSKANCYSSNLFQAYRI
jgi:hypothetical protein